MTRRRTIDPHKYRQGHHVLPDVLNRCRSSATQQSLDLLHTGSKFRKIEDMYWHIRNDLQGNE